MFSTGILKDTWIKLYEITYIMIPYNFGCWICVLILIWLMWLIDRIVMMTHVLLWLILNMGLMIWNMTWNIRMCVLLWVLRIGLNDTFYLVFTYTWISRLWPHHCYLYFFVNLLNFVQYSKWRAEYKLKQPNGIKDSIWFFATLYLIYFIFLYFYKF